jgi:hypothetical protein
MVPPDRTDDPYDEKRNVRQDRRLTAFEIALLKRQGHDPEDLKGYSAGRDLYKDEHGYVYVKDKGGSGPGEFTGIKLNTLQ